MSTIATPILWRSREYEEEQRLQNLTHTQPPRTLIDQFLLENSGSSVSVVLSNSEKVNGVLLYGSETKRPLLLLVKRNREPALLLVRISEVQAIGTPATGEETR